MSTIGMRISSGGSGQQVVQLGDVCLPALFERREQVRGAAKGIGAAGDALGAAVLAFGHQPGALEHGDMFLDGGERHVVAGGELAHRGFAVHHPRQDVAARGVGERAEDLVERLRGGLQIYNHMVVDSSIAAAVHKPNVKA
jgi:hypothetical protein